MNFGKNIQEFLYDKKYHIIIYDNIIHLYNYTRLMSVSQNKIEITIDNFKLNILGNDLFIIKMDIKEIMIRGDINEIQKTYQ